MNSIYKLRIKLIDSNPPIWRDFYTKEDVLLSELHQIIQIVMGWQDAHLHQFIHNRTSYGLPDPYDELGPVDYQVVKLNNLLIQKGDKIIYEYDFGDSWEHLLNCKKY